MGFDIKFYSYGGETNKIKKGLQINNPKYTINGTLVEDTSILTPSILFEGDLTKYATCNMCYIAVFNRWYFITDMITVSGGFIRVNLRVDVLFSYADQIDTCSGMVSRSSDPEVYNLYLEDSDFRSYTDDIISVISWGDTDLQNTSKILILGGAT